MYRRLLRVAFVLFAWVAAEETLRSTDAYHFDFTLESESQPDLDTTSTITGNAGDDVHFIAAMTLATTGLSADPLRGVQGWACGFWHAGLDIEFLSIAGTVSAFEADGGLRDGGSAGGFDHSFHRFETLDRTKNNGRRGAIQATILSFVDPVVLPPNTRQIIGRVHFKATIESAGKVAFFRYIDGLVGSGEPVANVVTVGGESRFPTLGAREIFIGAGATPETGELCSDGIDNDGDTWTDALDPGCGALSGGEICTDGVDNDGDGEIDCDDPGCSFDPACRERCNDGIDNDADGAVDCDDPECLGVPPCKPLENCSDGIDNDDDGDADCDDSECAGAPACRIPEICNDGVDNDGDGETDCDDSECFAVPPCPEPERCGDGVDNDEDGRTDCDDSDCEALGACRFREHCFDGVDNDIDGRIDCDDPDCDGVPPCGALEVCDDGIDNDRDGLIDCDDPACRTEVSCGGAEGFELVLTAEGARRELARSGDGAGDGASDGAAGGLQAPREVNVVSIDPGATGVLEVTTYIVPTPRAQDAGVQGWSISVTHDPALLVLENATIASTDAAELFDSGFEKTEGARRSFGAGDIAGFLSAVVLSFTQPVTLDPSIPQSIARTRYRIAGSGSGRGLATGGLGFEDGLVGSGQPVNNILTIQGTSAAPVRLVGLELRSAPPFLRGDANADGRVDIADAIWTINELLRGGQRTLCRLAADVNEDRRIDLTDPIYLVRSIFQQGPAIPPPYPECGTAAGSVVTCAEGSSCP